METFPSTNFGYVLAIHVLYLQVEGQGRAHWDMADMGRGAESVKTGKMAIKCSFFDQ